MIACRSVDRTAISGRPRPAVTRPPLSDVAANVRAVDYPDDLAVTRRAYDTVAADYARLLRDALAASPYDRAVLAAFADVVIGDGGGPVADIGCGPGRIAAHLSGLGLDVQGIDLSPAMVDVARATYPRLRFEVASMTDLTVADGSLSGLVAWYSIIHLPRGLVPSVFDGFRRALRPGGRVLLAFQVGDECVHLSHGYGHEITLAAYRWRPDRLAELLADAGFIVDARLVRAPAAPEKTEQAYLVAHRG
jgi:SAM-dependent methyltransferase